MPKRTAEDRRRIFDRTQGTCHLCEKQLAFDNYASYERRGGWHIDHVVPKALGGTDRGSNLLAACWECNLEKGTRSARSVRQANGLSGRPMSAAMEARARRDNAIVGGVAGSLLLAVIAPEIWVLGAIGGAIFGHESDPE